MDERAVIGIDFGTTNSLFSVILSGVAKPFMNQNNEPYPSVVAYDTGDPIVGHEARRRLDNINNDIIGGVIRSPKRLLGTSSVYIMGREIEPKKIVSDLMNGLKEIVVNGATKEELKRCNFNKAVVSIPVAMNGRTRRELRDACLQAGIQIVQFVHEPLAALYAHFRGSGQINKMARDYHDKLVLVYDWGGGTLDLTLCYISSGKITQIANVGDNEVGGDYIDEALREYIIEKVIKERGFSEKPKVRPGARSRLLNECEKIKKSLSSRVIDEIYIENYFSFSNNDDPDLECSISQDELNNISKKIIDRGLNCINILLDSYKINQRRISLCLATGGMINMPEIRKRLQEQFSLDRLEISNRGDKIISEGCAWIAADKARLTLAKPIEVREARNSYIKIFQEGTRLPLEGESTNPGELSLYCVDPRDGRAKIQLCRPERAEKASANDPRINYDTLVIPVDKALKPFMERIILKANIDHDLILHVNAKSEKNNEYDEVEIFDLEFGLKLVDKITSNAMNSSNHETNDQKAVDSGVVIRSNITKINNYQAAIPGEYLHEININAFDSRSLEKATSTQIQEYHIYTPCSICGRGYNDPNCNCSSLL